MQPDCDILSHSCIIGTDIALACSGRLKERPEFDILNNYYIMITEKLEKAFNDQITAELWSSNLYLQMAFYLQKEGWDGFAHWMLKQSDEEKQHAVELAGYLAKRGGTATINMVDVVPNGWGSVEEVFKHVYEHECNVSKLINDLVDVAAAEKDKATQDFLWGFVREQVEEEATALSILEKVRKSNGAGIFYIDGELAKR